ncbi:MAG: hypothetical protein ACI93R_003319, partial [Flavobacteriales bacterium]
PLFRLTFSTILTILVVSDCIGGAYETHSAK